MVYHIPVLSSESIEGLNVRPDGIYFDLTFGGGGHSRAILSKLGEKGKLFAFDQDMDALSNAPADKRLTLIHSNFRFLQNFLDYYRIEKIDGVLADLGISSHQIDTESRGFTYMGIADLDMRMNSSSETRASDIINSYTESELNRVFRDYGELSNFKALSSRIVEKRKASKISNSKEFTDAISEFLPSQNPYSVLSRIFQALRIEVNDEMGALKEMLLQLPGCLNSGARIVILTYHSLEDRLVKNFFRTGGFGSEVEKDFYGNPLVPFKLISKNPLTPGNKEVLANKRSRSAKLRIAEKI
jgi:16S rRNA (cytosine1402-N4)-methyltransferase